MNHAKNSPRVGAGRAASLMAMALASTALLSICIADASAAGRGGSRAGGGGQMAHSSVSGANRANAGNVNTGNVNRGNINSGNVNRGNVNTGNINVGNDVNIDIDRGHGYHGGYYHPVARAATIGAIAVTTAAIVGSYYYALPPAGCSVVYKAGVNYHYCGTVYYQQTWSGDKVVYVVVSP